ncbi:MAG: hypothetical protein QXI61_06625 [Nitrososphaerota archaeon]
MIEPLLTYDNKLAIVDAGESCNVVCKFSFGSQSFNKASILSLRLTLYDRATGQAINGRVNQDIYDANGGTIADDGTLTIRLQPEDNIIVNEALQREEIEDHIVSLRWTWNDGVYIRVGVEQLVLRVRKI